MYKARLLILLLFVLEGCIEKLDLSVVSTTPALVVDGLITNEPGSHQIKLFLATSGNGELNDQTPVTSAEVQITKDDQENILLTEAQPGVYQTPADFMAEYGHRYQLRIQTSEGKNYESYPTQMMPAGKLDSAYFEFQENVINQNDESSNHDAFAVYINGSGTAGDQNLLRWRSKLTYQIHTFPELRTKDIGKGAVSILVPDPLPCSGYIADTVTWELLRIGQCECCDCYVQKPSKTVITSPNLFLNQTSFNKIQVLQIPADKSFFYNKVVVEIDQLSLDPRVFEFWRLIEIQQEGITDIFQPNAVRITGNIYNVRNPAEDVFGVFSVSAVSKKRLVISRTDIPRNRISGPDTLTIDCRTFIKGATTEKPEIY